MISATRVPFGRHLETGNIVSAHAVSSGRDCGCICVSCDLPLIAKQGSQLIWHFAHDPIKGQSEVLCEFSLFVTLRRIAQQELVRRSPISNFKLPDYIIESSEPLKLGADVSWPNKVVTERSEVSLHSITTDTSLGGMSMDILAHVKDTPLGISFLHPEKSSFPNNKLENGRYGVITIDLTPLEGIDRHDIDPTDRLLAQLTNDIASKSWCYHPNENAVRSELRRDLKERMRKHQAEEKNRQKEKKRIEDLRRVRLINDTKALKTQQLSKPSVSTRVTYHCSGCYCWFVDKELLTVPKCIRCSQSSNVSRFQ